MRSGRSSGYLSALVERLRAVVEGLRSRRRRGLVEVVELAQVDLELAA